MKTKFKKIYNLFIHYGSKNFNKDLIDRNNIENFKGMFNKPGINCLYGCPVQSNNTWKSFAYLPENKLFRKKIEKSKSNYFYFSLTGKVKVIQKAKDLWRLPILIDEFGPQLYWHEIAKKYDAVIIMFQPNFESRNFKLNALYESLRAACDVDSVIVFNPDSVIFHKAYEGKLLSRKIRKETKRKREA